MATLPQPSASGADGPGGLALRLSDGEREHAVGLLNQAVADGRLTWVEHAERVESVWSARTRGELTPVLADLGATSAARSAPLASLTGAQEVSATLSKIIRQPDLTRPIVARSLFGAVYLDLRDAEPGAELRVDVQSFGGKVVLWVGDDATVIDEGEVVLGKRKVLASAPAGSGAMIRITGRSVLGHLKVLSGPHHWGSWAH
ncbi:MAG TPA: DUF1707 domain-containing protein [Pseudonocardiaceae bacterium]|nr:DUF1707 domain-containing protein [Pseudonocardiaceae bacterium]